MDISLISILLWLSFGFIIYVYAGYPVFLMLIAGLKPKVEISTDNSFSPEVTILISAYNEEKVIAGKLKNTLELEYPRDRFQILVAADGSDDNTLEIVKSFGDQGVEYCYIPQRRGKMAAINRAMKEVRGEIVIFSDANNMYDKDAVRQLLAPFLDKRWGGVTGAKRIINVKNHLGASEGIYWKYESFIKEQETRLGTCITVPGEIFAMRRDLYTNPPQDTINDDFYMAVQILKKNFNICYQPRAKSYEPVSKYAIEEINRRTRIIAGRYQAIFRFDQYLSLGRPVVLWQIISHKFARPLVPIFMLGVLLCSVLSVVFTARPSSSIMTDILTLASPFNWIILSIQAVFYILAFTGNCFTKKPESISGKALYIITFLVNSNIAALLGLFKYLTGKQSVLWKKANR
jgi:biofilm PGA synthesis N-glycosyltransferase PgaC